MRALVTTQQSWKPEMSTQPAPGRPGQAAPSLPPALGGQDYPVTSRSIIFPVELSLHSRSRRQEDSPCSSKFLNVSKDKGAN